MHEYITIVKNSKNVDKANCPTQSHKACQFHFSPKGNFISSVIILPVPFCAFRHICEHVKYTVF